MKTISVVGINTEANAKIKEESDKVLPIRGVQRLMVANMKAALEVFS